MALRKEPKLAPKVPKFRPCCGVSDTELPGLAVQSGFYISKTEMKWLYMENSYIKLTCNQNSEIAIII